MSDIQIVNNAFLGHLRSNNIDDNIKNTMYQKPLIISYQKYKKRNLIIGSINGLCLNIVLTILSFLSLSYFFILVPLLVIEFFIFSFMKYDAGTYLKSFLSFSIFSWATLFVLTKFNLISELDFASMNVLIIAGAILLQMSMKNNFLRLKKDALYLMKDVEKTMQLESEKEREAKALYIEQEQERIKKLHSANPGRLEDSILVMECHDTLDYGFYEINSAKGLDFDFYNLFGLPSKKYDFFEGIYYALRDHNYNTIVIFHYSVGSKTLSVIDNNKDIFKIPDRFIVQISHFIYNYVKPENINNTNNYIETEKNGTKTIQKHMSHMKDIDIIQSNIIGTEIENFSNVKFSNNSRNEFFVLKDMKNLESLNFCKAKNLIIENCPNLKYLKEMRANSITIRNCPQLVDIEKISISNIEIENCNNLKTFSVKSENFSKIIFKYSGYSKMNLTHFESPPVFEGKVTFIVGKESNNFSWRGDVNKFICKKNDSILSF